MKSVILCLFIVASCSGTQKADEHTALVCAESALAKDIAPTAESILVNGTSSWEAQLTALGLAFGNDVLGCAVTLAKTELVARAGNGNQPDQLRATIGAATALQRADQYLKDHGGV